jgi:formiminotetrahydrofolate cyclodeaminase
MTLSTQTLNCFLDDLASKQPAPGGGAVAGVLAGISTALGNMVLAYSQGKQSLKEHDELHEDCMKFLVAAKDEAITLGDADAAAYEKVSALWKLSKSDPNRIDQWDTALKEAVQIPLQTMELCQRILVTLKTLIGKTNDMLASDLAIAAILAESSARAACWNVRANTMQMDCETQKNSFNEQSVELLDSCKQLAQLIEQSCGV